jgi:ComF family protein
MQAAVAAWSADARRQVSGSIQIATGDCQPMTRFQVDRGADAICGWLLPPRCVLCGLPGQRPCLDLCPGCEAGLPLDPQALQTGPSPIGRSLAAFAYAFPVDHLVQALKYRGQLAVGRVLGTLLAQSVQRLGLHHDVDCVVPVPLHPGRYADRGFNQSAEIARRAARLLGRESREGEVSRIRDTRPQVGLRPEQRRLNIDGAFVATARLQGRRIALVDDVLTTGATAGAVAAALHSAGASSVDVWCVARAAHQ